MVLGFFLLALLLPEGEGASEAPFLRGNVGGRGRLDVTDAIQILRFLFLGGADTGIACLDAADADDDGQVAVSDAVLVLQFLFLHGPRPPAPFPSCGWDSTPDALDCEGFPACAGEVAPLALAADAVVFVIDRSSTMLDRGELAIAKREVVAAISLLQEASEAGVLYFASHVSSFPPAGPPLKLVPEARAAMTSFVLWTPGASGTCPLPALLAALEMLRLSGDARKAVVLLSDGGATCNGADEAAYWRETLNAVTAKNTEGVKIHSVGVSLDVELPGETYLRDLAARNGGSYVRISE